MMKNVRISASIWIPFCTVPQSSGHFLTPGIWVTERAYNERDLAVTLDGFLAEREKSLAWLKGLSMPNWEAEHSDQFGTITAGEMFTAWVDHDNLHIRQLVELRHVKIVSQAKPFDTRYAGEW